MRQVCVTNDNKTMKVQSFESFSFNLSTMKIFHTQLEHQSENCLILFI